jgi:outer membrane lipoprotein-sorting protein
MQRFYFFGTDFEAAGINYPMKQRSYFLAILLLLSLRAIAQNDNAAMQILDSFSAKAKNAPSVSMKFNMVTVNQMEKSTDTLSGKVILSGDKYRLDLPDNIIFFNGDASWSYLPAEQEVTVTKPDKKDNSFQNRPSSIFSIYRNGYKCRLIEEKANSYTIDLYPEDLKTEILRIRLVIGKPQFNLINLEYKRKDGVVNTLHVLEYDLKSKPAPDTFTFRKDKYKDVDIIDMR